MSRTFAPFWYLTYTLPLSNFLQFPAFLVERNADIILHSKLTISHQQKHLADWHQYCLEQNSRHLTSEVSYRLEQLLPSFLANHFPLLPCLTQFDLPYQSIFQSLRELHEDLYVLQLLVKLYCQLSLKSHQVFQAVYLIIHFHYQLNRYIILWILHNARRKNIWQLNPFE